MTFLQLVQALQVQAGVNGPAISTVVGQSFGSELYRCVDWTRRAWLDIQGSKKWSFLWEQTTLVVLAGTRELATDLPADRWDKSTTWRYPLVGGNANQFMTYLPWQRFSINYDDNSLVQTDNQSVWTIRPDNAFVLNAKASVDTTFLVQRWKNPQTLVSDNDVPLLPEDLHDLIVWTALKKYAGYDEAGNQRNVALDEMRDMRRALNRRCLPDMEMGGDLLYNQQA